MTADKVSKEIANFAVRCSADAVVLEVVSEATADIPVGAPFVNLLDHASHGKARAFFSVLKQQKSAFGWELNVARRDGAVESMHFAGAVSENCDDEGGETFLIVAAQSRGAVSRVYQDFARLNNRQTDNLRAAQTDLSIRMREQEERDSRFYDELSRLNNELTTAQRELAKKNAALARLNEQKNQFLGIAAHDLRNPLDVIQTYSEFLLEDASAVLSEEQIDFIHKIYSSSAYMLYLVNDFLDYSRIEAGRLDLDKSSSDLSKLCEKVVERSRVIADKKQTEIVFDAAENLPAILIDESKIEQVLSNLIGNAIKFSPAGSCIEIGLIKRGTEFVLSVKDDGPGIAQTEAETLFAPFVRGKTKATGGEKSTGLGLAIVKKIVEGHGGAIAVETAPGRGSTFYVSLPLKKLEN